MRKEGKYLCSARLSSRHTLWQHQRKQRRVRAQQPTQEPAAQPHNGHTGPENGQLKTMAKFSEVNGVEATNDQGDEDEGVSLAESFLLGEL